MVQIQRERMLAEIIRDRDAMIEGLFQEVQRLRAELDQTSKGSDVPVGETL